MEPAGFRSHGGRPVSGTHPYTFPNMAAVILETQTLETALIRPLLCYSVNAVATLDCRKRKSPSGLCLQEEAGPTMRTAVFYPAQASGLPNTASRGVSPPHATKRLDCC